jgi:hypothetical protein
VCYVQCGTLPLLERNESPLEGQRDEGNDAPSVPLPHNHVSFTYLMTSSTYSSGILSCLYLLNAKSAKFTVPPVEQFLLPPNQELQFIRKNVIVDNKLNYIHLFYFDNAVYKRQKLMYTKL